MAVKIRLTRIGRHKDPFYRVVAADAHFARDGRIVEQIGIYDPSKGVKAAEINEELALKWLANGAIPTGTAKTILSSKGIIAKATANKKAGK